MKPERLQKIDEIFQAALDLPPERRENFVAEACAGDAELRAEVESLLAAHEHVGNFIADSASDVAAVLLAKDSPRFIQVGQYKIEKLLGAGGMGEVYLSTDKMGRRVALKLLASHLDSDRQQVARFLQEARTVLALNHPNIVTIYDIGETGGSYYIASELIEGENLRRRFETDKLELNTVLEILIQVATALSAAHEKGIVHRDIKPENVMIRSDGYVKVLDFGIAKLTQDFVGFAGTDMPTMHKVDTAEGIVIGTATYMSPEQARGLNVDARTDIWSVGVMLYEMLAGQMPFAGGTKAEVVACILDREPAPLARYVTEPPAELQRIVTKALMKKREERYQTIKDMLLDLRALKQELEFAAKLERSAPPHADAAAYSTGEAAAKRRTAPKSVSASGLPSLSSAEYIVSGIKEHKRAFAIAASVLLLAIIGISYWYFSHLSSLAPIESIAVLPFQNRSTEADTDYLSDGLAESLIYRLSQLPNLKVSPTSSVFRYKGKEIDPVKVGRELGVNAVLSGRMVQRGDNLTISAELVDVRYNKLLWGEQYERKMSELLATQREIAREIVEKLKLKVSGEEKGLAKHYTESNEAYQLYLKGRFYWNKRSEEGMHKSIEYFQQAIDRDPDFALAYSGLADSYDLLGIPEAGGGVPPSEVLPKAKAAALKALEIDETLSEPHVSLAHVKFFYDRDSAGAEREYKRAIELNPNYAMAHHWYAIYLSVVGRQREALAEIRRAQDLDPLSLPINIWLGRILSLVGQSDQAVEQLRKTVEMDPNFVLAHYRLGVLYEEKGMYEEAISEFKQVLKLSGGKPLGVAALARAYALAGKREEAQKNLDELLQMSMQRYVSPTSIALIYIAFGDKDKAFAWLDEADKAHDPNVVRIREDPRFESLRSDPRFNDLVRRIGIP